MAITTPENYFDLTGIDLNAELSAVLTDDVGDQNPAPRFIESVEIWCREYLVEKYENSKELLKNSFDFPTHARDCFVRGVCYQITYVLRNGNLSNESGFVASQGMIVSRETLDKLSLSSNALTRFRLGGLANAKKY